MSRGDSSFQILERINDNAYKIYLLGEYGISATFNVYSLSLFNVGDNSKSNSFKKRGDDVIQTTPKDLLEVPVGPITRSKGKKAQLCIQWAYLKYLYKIPHRKRASRARGL